MAKRTTVRTREQIDWVKFLAFWGLVIASVIFVAAGIIKLFEFENVALVVSILDIVAKVFLLIAVGVPGFGYVRGKHKAWQIIFWVALIIYAAGVVFGIVF